MALTKLRGLPSQCCDVGALGKFTDYFRTFIIAAAWDALNVVIYFSDISFVAES